MALVPRGASSTAVCQPEEERALSVQLFYQLNVWKIVLVRRAAERSIIITTLSYQEKKNKDAKVKRL